MIAALNNTTTLNGPGATTGQSARVREAGVDDPSSASQAEASAVVSLSAQAANLAAAGGSSSSSGAQTATGPSAAVQTATAQPVTAAPPAQAASTTQAQATPTPTPTATAQAQATPTAPAPAPSPTVAAQTTSFQPSNARAATTGEKQEFPPTVSLVPNLVYAEADSDQNGVVSPSERRAYDVVHPKLGERPADVPAKRVVDAELREYTSIANNRF